MLQFFRSAPHCVVHPRLCPDCALKCDKMWKAGRVGHRQAVCEKVRSSPLGRCCHLAVATGSFCHPETSLRLATACTGTVHTVYTVQSAHNARKHPLSADMFHEYDSKSSRKRYQCAQKTKFVVNIGHEVNLQHWTGWDDEWRWTLCRPHNSRWIHCQPPSSFVTLTSHQHAWVCVYARVCVCVCQWLTRVKKVISRRERENWNQFLPFREENEKSEFTFPSFEKRKRNLKTISLISRGERESWIPFP